MLDVPSAGFLNGMTAVPSVSGILLTAYSSNGLVYRINTSNKTSSILLDDPTLESKLSAPLKLGVNGLHARDGYLYFDNTFKSPLLARMPYHLKSDTIAGPVEVIFEFATFPLVEGGGHADDFTFDRAGDIWLACASSRIVRLDIQD
jgi:hypothetical protein